MDECKSSLSLKKFDVNINNFIKSHHLKMSTSNSSPNNNSNLLSQISKYFIPGFFAVWAIGYSLLAAVEVGGSGLGDLGGVIGTGFVILLMVALFGAIIYEVIKPDEK